MESHLDKLGLCWSHKRWDKYVIFFVTKEKNWYDQQNL